MRRNIFSKKIYKVILIVAIFGLLVFLNPKNFFDGIRSPFFKMAYFFEKIFQISSEKIYSGVSTVSSIGSLKRDNDQLAAQNATLLAENVQLDAIREENEILRKQLNLLPKKEFDLENAEVISQGMQGLNDWIVVNKGSSSGIEKGMSVVVFDKIIIGRVEEVLPQSAKIVLITDASSTINAVTVQTDAKGVVKGEYGIGLILDMVLETNSLSVGDKVITSGIGEVPEGFLIGRISEIRTSDDYLFQQAVVVSPVDLSRLKFVSIVIGAE